MVYVITQWNENNMSTTAKVNGLNNLETVYSSTTTYIDAMIHSDRYYTKSHCDSTYFTAADDGSGTGLVAATLDGFTTQQILDAGTPAGCIGIWYSSKGSIPVGWYLCDGNNSTPNMQDRFIVGSGGNYSYGAIGGSDTVTITGSITVAGHALTAAEIAKHQHGTITDYYPTTFINQPVDQSSGGYIVNSTTTPGSVTTSTGSGISHGHTASLAGTSNQDKRPPFYALCYIMKGF